MPRKFGQHFLRDQRILARIAEAACPEAREPLLLEIGPGRGALTEHLIRRCERLVAFEIDPQLIDGLRERFPSAEIVHQDILDADLAGLPDPAICGNLPYYITSPILSKITSLPSWKRAVFLIQREVALRVAAGPGSRDYGYLSVATQLAAHVDLLFNVPPYAFSPPPQVDSAVIRLRPRIDRPGNLNTLLPFVGHCFAHKRKTLRNNLLPHYERERVESLPEAQLRAEQIPVDQFPALYSHLTA